ncbi:MAG: hypothetical protein ACRDYA_11185 [Egibacteraceae bacterium]
MPAVNATERGNSPPIRGLFQQRVSGDDALLRLLQLRFAQAGLSAELYADTPEQLDTILDFVPPQPGLPTVHLNRGVDLLDKRGRETVETFATRFTSRVSGLVVHDKAAMATRVPDLVAAMHELAGRLGGRPDRPWVFLEYAAGLDLEQFVEIGERLRDLERVSLCIDIGHVGIRQARSHFASSHPGVDLAALDPQDARLPDLIADVEDAVASALPAVLEMTRLLGSIGKTVHFHLHDGHPLIPGLSDHFSFLTRVPIPFIHRGLRSLSPLYGPSGLTEILRAAISACGVERTSLTLEIHQAEGRLPLGDAAELFGHWHTFTNAERLNYWLSVIAANHVLATSALESAVSAGSGRDGE